MNLNDPNTTPKGTTSRLSVALTASERAAFDEFRKATRRNSLTNAIVAAGLLGLDTFWNKTQRKGMRLEPPGDSQPEGDAA